MDMTIEKALDMIKARLKCMERDNGCNTQCNMKECDSCDLCYEQGTWGEHKRALRLIIETIEKENKNNGKINQI